MNDPIPTFNPMNMKGSIREFERWFQEKKDTWPPELQRLGERAVLTLKSLDQFQADQSPAFMKASADDLMAFGAAYTEWRKSQQ